MAEFILAYNSEEASEKVAVDDFFQCETFQQNYILDMYERDIVARAFLHLGE